MKPDYETARKIVNLLNELLTLDRNAVACLIANRVPCNEALAGHETVQVTLQNEGFNVGLLGLLNGLCGSTEDYAGLIIAHFETDPKANFNRLVKFTVRENN